MSVAGIAPVPTARSRTLDIFRGRLVRFAGVGATGIIVNQLAMFLVADVLGAHYLIAAILASQASTTWNFVLIESFVFPGRAGGWSLVKRFIRFDIVNMSTLVIRGPALVFGVEVLGLNYLLVNLCTLVGLFGLRYLLADAWIWRHHGEAIVAAGEDLDDVTTEDA